jgi:hypothetical protein
MEQRCVLCNEAIIEEDISGAIDFDLWDEFRFGEDKDKVDENGQQLPPESADCGVRWSANWGWVHLGCETAYGSGLTSEAFWEQLENSLRGRR